MLILMLFYISLLLETLGKKSGEFLAAYAKKKNCMVFYGASKRDSLLAANFIQAAHQKWTENHGCAQSSEGWIKNDISTSSRRPLNLMNSDIRSNSRLPKDSLGSIFVASDDALIYAKS